MPADPIPIATQAPTQALPIGRSPPQMFSPPSAVGLGSSAPGAAAASLFGKWNAFASTGKSPTAANYFPGAGVGNSPPGVPAATAKDIPPHEDHDRFDHDSLEFGGGWAATAAARGQRRAASVSLSPTATFGSQGGVMSPPMNAPVLSDKMAYGNGVLRRLSFTSGFAKPAVPSSVPRVPSPPNPTPIAGNPLQKGNPVAGLAVHPPSPPDTLSPNVPRGAAATGRRRFSESGARKRGVSPMGERLLRDQNHF